MQMPKFLRNMTSRRFYQRRTMSRPMTVAEEKAFDKVFERMDDTFKAMGEFFDLANSSHPGHAPASDGKPHNDGAKGRNHDG